MICVTLMMSIFIPHVSKLKVPIVKFFSRCIDRGCRWSLKNENGTDHDVHTSKLLQSDLNDLYTGDEIAGHNVYAQNFTYLWCVLAYSGGLPILYPFGCIFFFVLYWVYKFLLLKYYAKTSKFNEEMPLSSIWYIKVGLIIHCVFTLFMITNAGLLPIEESFFNFKEQEPNVIAQLFTRFFFREYAIIYVLGLGALIVLFIFK